MLVAARMVFIKINVCAEEGRADAFGGREGKKEAKRHDYNYYHYYFKRRA